MYRGFSFKLSNELFYHFFCLMADKTISKLVHWGLCDGIGIEQHLSYRREIKDTVERVINRVKKRRKKLMWR